MTENFINLERKINYSFKNKIYLSTALTHSSKSKNNNERLEYLGDAVINLAISDYLIKNFTDLDEGSLSILRSNLVSRATLSKVASQLGLESYLKIGKSLLGFIPMDQLSQILTEAIENKIDFGGVMGWKIDSDINGVWGKTMQNCLDSKKTIVEI